MIITDRFVLLNFPKTGSSFVRQAIKQIYGHHGSAWKRVAQKLGLVGPGYLELYHPKIDEASHLGTLDQHGTLRQIPAQHRGKPIVTVTREPLSRYLSAYHYGWWKTNPPVDIQSIKQLFPTFPNLGLLEYYEMVSRLSCRDRLGGVMPKIRLGLHSIQFIQFYTRDPESILREIDQDFIDDNRIASELHGITFLQQADLRNELTAFMRAMDIEEEQLASLQKIDRVNVTPQSESAGLGDSDMAELASRIRRDDRMLYTLFPEYLKQ